MSSKRPSCSRCLRPEKTCLCHWITPLNNQVQLVILQHPLEVHNAKNSARLLYLSLANSQLLTGETFTGSDLQDSLINDRHSILLYPDSADPALPTPRPLPDPPPLPDKLRLIVLDATWRKSRKMLYLNPSLQQLPRLSLSNCPPSRYLIRRAQREGQLSTLEASCYALAQLEGNSEVYRPLLDAFDQFVYRQAGFIEAGLSCDSTRRHE